MRFMVMVKASKDSEAGKMPSQELLTAMGKFNEELVKAGIMQAGEGLKPSSAGKRIAFSGGGSTVVDGPFTVAHGRGSSANQFAVSYTHLTLPTICSV